MNEDEGSCVEWDEGFQDSKLVSGLGLSFLVSEVDTRFYHYPRS